MKRILVVCSFILLQSIAFAQKEPPQTIQVKEHLFMISGLGGNVSFLITDGGVVVVDAGNSLSDGKTILDIIKEKTDKPVKYLILTHYHSDHTNGMQAFPPEVISIGQKNIIDNLHTRKAAMLQEAINERLPENIKNIKTHLAALRTSNSPDTVNEEKRLLAAEAQLEELKKIQIIDPTRTFELDTTLILGNDTIELSYPGKAHTKCNSLIYFRTAHVLQTGDILFNGMFPFIAWQDGIDTKNWIHILQSLSTDSRFDTVIPGHGTLTTRDGLLRAAEYLTDLRTEVEIEIKEGKTLDEMKRSITMPKYKDFKRPQGLAQNIESVYMEMQKP